MADNTKWILDNEPPGAKIVLWAHNFHISLNSYPGHPFIFLGSHLRQMLGNDYLSIGFVFNQGPFQGIDYTLSSTPFALKSFTVGPYEGSFGAAMSRTDIPLFLLDLRRIPLEGVVHDWFAAPHVFKWINSIYASEKDIKYFFQLPTIFDAVIFIDKTTRARPNTSSRKYKFPY